MTELNPTFQLLEKVEAKLNEALQAADEASEHLIAVLICHAREVSLTRLKELKTHLPN